MSTFENEFSNNKYEEGDFYWDERGYRVFTAQFLLRRGYCCKNGCRHCPYSVNEKASPRDKTVQ